MYWAWRKLLFEWQDFNPIPVRVTDEIKSHVGVFITDAPHFPVIFPDFVIISRNAEAEVVFALSQIVGFRTVTKPGQFQCKTRLSVS